MGPQISCVQKYDDRTKAARRFSLLRKKGKKKSFHHTEKYRSRRIAATLLFLCAYNYSPSLASHHPRTPPLGPCVTVRLLGKCACVCGCVDVRVSHYSGLSMTWCAEGIQSVFSISDNVFVLHPLLLPPPPPKSLFSFPWILLGVLLFLCLVSGCLGHLVVAKLYQSGKNSCTHVSDEPPLTMSGYGKSFFRRNGGAREVSEVPLVGSGPRFRLLGTSAVAGSM
ncbi:hypothetical protein BDP67DRAFT_258151 [Colletotrichum lupini]|nr:hypothetical protein BDP67DRAFT_258151 [Colletotrichum lupini]